LIHTLAVVTSKLLPSGTTCGSYLQPNQGSAGHDVPEFLESCFHFTKEITALVKRYLERAHQIQGRLSIPVQHGPWQGGSADYSQGQGYSQFEALCHFRIASLNMGALAEEVAAKPKCTA